MTVNVRWTSEGHSELSSWAPTNGLMSDLFAGVKASL